jgi:hypothetical protein
LVPELRPLVPVIKIFVLEVWVLLGLVPELRPLVPVLKIFVLRVWVLYPQFLT